MGQKSHPTSLRLEHTNRSFDMEWYSHHFYKELLSRGIQVSQHLNGVLRRNRYPNGRFFLQGGGNRERVYLFFYNTNTKGLKEVRKKKFRLRPRKLKGLKGRIERLREKQELMMEKIRNGQLSPKKWRYIPHIPTFIHNQIMKRSRTRGEKSRPMRYPFVEIGLNFSSKDQIFRKTSLYKEFYSRGSYQALPLAKKGVVHKVFSSVTDYRKPLGDIHKVYTGKELWNERLQVQKPLDPYTYKVNNRKEKEEGSVSPCPSDIGFVDRREERDRGAEFSSSIFLQIDPKYALSSKRVFFSRLREDLVSERTEKGTVSRSLKERLSWKELYSKKKRVLSSLYPPSKYRRVMRSLFQPTRGDIYLVDKEKREKRKLFIPAFTSSWFKRRGFLGTSSATRRASDILIHNVNILNKPLYHKKKKESPPITFLPHLGVCPPMQSEGGSLKRKVSGLLTFKERERPDIYSRDKTQGQYNEYKLSFLESSSRLEDYHRRHLLTYNTSLPIPLKKDETKYKVNITPLSYSLCEKDLKTRSLSGTNPSSFSFPYKVDKEKERKRRLKGEGFWNPPFVEKGSLPFSFSFPVKREKRDSLSPCEATKEGVFFTPTLQLKERFAPDKDKVFKGGVSLTKGKINTSPKERERPDIYSRDKAQGLYHEHQTRVSQESRREEPTLRERMTVRGIRTLRRLKGGVRSLLAAASISSSKKIREVRRMNLYYPLFMGDRAWPKSGGDRSPLFSLSEKSFSNPLYTLFLKKGLLQPLFIRGLQSGEQVDKDKIFRSLSSAARKNTLLSKGAGLSRGDVQVFLSKKDQLDVLGVNQPQGFLFKKRKDSQGSYQPSSSEALHLNRRLHPLLKGLKGRASLLIGPRDLKEKALDGFAGLRLGLRRRGLLSAPFYQGFLEQVLSLHANHPVFFQPFRVPRETQSSQFLAESLAYLLERRVPWLKLKYHVLREIGRNRKIEGVRVSFSGRLGGRSKKAQRSRTQTFLYGSTSLHVFSGKIDFYSTAARTSFGLLGVKVWISYKTKRF